MKLVHLSDLHLGKRVNEFSMLDDQAYILREIVQILQQEQPEAVMIAGDIYDKSVPGVEAVQLFDDFLNQLVQQNLSVFMISGNHDSSERVAFGARLMKRSGVYIAPVYQGEIQSVTLEDKEGKVNIYMLPFVKPSHVRRYFPEENIESYQDAIRVAMQNLAVDTTERNILMTHQFVTGASRCESEEISVGGTDNIEAGLFEAFDYVALGHLHQPQSVIRETIRYCGTPLKYSFSEARQEKSLTVVEMGAKGRIAVRTIPLVPQREMQEIRGTYAQLAQKDFYIDSSYPGSYLHVTLTDEEDIPDAIGKLRKIYPYMMKLDYDNQRTRQNRQLGGLLTTEQKTPLMLFQELYLQQNNQPMTEEQSHFLMEQIESIWEEEE